MNVKVLNENDQPDEEESTDIKQFFRDEFQKWLDVYETAQERVDLDKCERAHEKLKRISPLKQKAETKFPDKPTYRVSSWLLEEAFDYLTGLPEERITFVAGQKVGDSNYTLERMLKLDQEIQTTTRAKADVNSAAAALSRIDEYEMSFSAHLHSHPNLGKGGTIPSGKDRNFQDRLESGGHICIGGIFSRDGFVRFFSNNRDFELKIIGTGVEKLEEDRLFQLNQHG